MHDLLKSETSPDSTRRAAGDHRRGRGRGKPPVLVKVLAAVAGVGLLLLGVLGSPDRSLGRSPEVVGEREMVRISGPNGKTAEVLALIDTGASASSLDTALAKDLGFDLAAAPGSRSVPRSAARSAPSSTPRCAWPADRSPPK